MPERDERHRVHGFEYSGAGLPVREVVPERTDNGVAPALAPAPLFRPTEFWTGPPLPHRAREGRFWTGVAFGVVFGLFAWALAVLGLWVVLRWF
jgi:hypothetical protein